MVGQWIEMWEEVAGEVAIWPPGFILFFLWLLEVDNESVKDDGAIIWKSKYVYVTVWHEAHFSYEKFLFEPFHEKKPKQKKA